MLDKRIISAAIALPLLFLAVLIDSKVFLGALCILTFIGLYEYFKAVKNGINKPMKFTGMLFGIIILLLFSSKSTQSLMIPAMTLITLILLSIPIFNRKYNFIGAGITVLGILYIPIFFGYLYLIRAIPNNGVYLIWFVFITSWFSDTFAYFTGRAFGKTKLSPDVSPHKTVEGAIGGIAASIIACVVYGHILNTYSVIAIPYFDLVILGALGSMVSVLGDLAASSIKRSLNVKDYGSIMPGHGGVLDRFDSILFTAPLIYYYIAYIL